ncbi:hypothetical protein WN51_01585 [Melipona quadrifasciata]|uniref:Uncharacterized protein n=1 Tax=Melipona quadrifasciata TaxID=166423 RepID=A0A0N0BE38_9HYME|nr:hypothetical protein WN51_01585 [Melipona quadrifasciata]
MEITIESAAREVSADEYRKLGWGRTPSQTTEVRSACWRLPSVIARPSFTQIDYRKTDRLRAKGSYGVKYSRMSRFSKVMIVVTV